MIIFLLFASSRKGKLTFCLPWIYATGMEAGRWKKLPVPALISREKTVKLCRKKANFRESVDIFYGMCYDACVSIGKSLSKARYSTAG